MVARYAAALCVMLVACARATPAPCTDLLPPVIAARVEDPALDEISGLAQGVRNPDLLWAVEDSGNPPLVHALDNNGHTIGHVRLDGIDNVDWEALALGPCGDGTCIFVADIGDNLAARDNVRVLRFPEPLMAAGAEHHVTPDQFSFRYPSGAQDAEALVVTPDGLPLILTKRMDGHSQVFAFPRLATSDVVTLHDLGAISTAFLGMGLPTSVTAADLWPDGSRLVVRTYAGMWEFSVDGSLLRADALHHRDVAPVPPDVQGESVAYDAVEGGYWTVSEGPHAPLWRVACRGL